MSSLKTAIAGQILAEAIDLGARVTEKNVAVTATATTTLNCALGNVFAIALGVNISTLQFSNVPASGKVFSMTLKLTQDATGNRSVTWPASIKWPGNTAPTLTATANKYDVLVLWTSDGGVTWTGSVGSQNY